MNWDHDPTDGDQRPDNGIKACLLPDSTHLLQLTPDRMNCSDDQASDYESPLPVEILADMTPTMTVTEPPPVEPPLCNNDEVAESAMEPSNSTTNTPVERQTSIADIAEEYAESERDTAEEDTSEDEESDIGPVTPITPSPANLRRPRRVAAHCKNDKSALTPLSSLMSPDLVPHTKYSRSVTFAKESSLPGELQALNPEERAEIILTDAQLLKVIRMAPIVRRTFAQHFSGNGAHIFAKHRPLLETTVQGKKVQA